MTATLEFHISDMAEPTHDNIDRAVARSTAVILAYQQPSGAYPASPNFANYQYSWLRDGAFIADGMSRVGQVDSAERFFDWCAKIVVDRRERILSGGKLDARYDYEGHEVGGEWGNFQLDGYGTLLWAIKQHAERHGRATDRYREATGLLQHYLATNWQEPCYDWWEERVGRHAASLACIYAGLKAYGHPEAETVHRAIDLSRERTDASLLACGLFGAVSAETFRPVLAAIEAELSGGDGGVYRYREDSYYGGGQWPLLTSMMGWYYLGQGRSEDARQKLTWVLNKMQPNGWLPEQSSDHLLSPDDYQPWVERWGTPANPLLWSQAMLLTLASEYKAAGNAI